MRNLERIYLQKNSIYNINLIIHKTFIYLSKHLILFTFKFFFKDFSCFYSKNLLSPILLEEKCLNLIWFDLHENDCYLFFLEKEWIVKTLFSRKYFNLIFCLLENDVYKLFKEGFFLKFIYKEYSNSFFFFSNSISNSIFIKFFFWQLLFTKLSPN